MQIVPVNNNRNNNYHPKFGHTFRVNICTLKHDGSGYDFVSPAKNTKLYKKLNSKVVGWLNEDFITDLRNKIGVKRKISRVKSPSDAEKQKNLIKDLKRLDKDYKDLNIVRSVYDKYRLGHIATGIDVPILENLKGAAQIGIAKKEAIWQDGVSHNEFVKKICETFRKNAKKYVQSPVQQLRSKNGKSYLLQLNFRTAGTNKKGKEIYELDNYNFYEVKKSQKLTPEEKEIYKQKYEHGAYAQIIKTIKHQIDKIVGENTLSIVPKAAKTASKDKTIVKEDQNPVQQIKKRRKKKIKDDPRQLKIPFVFED